MFTYRRQTNVVISKLFQIGVSEDLDLFFVQHMRFDIFVYKDFN